MAVVHAGGGGGEEQHALYKAPHGNGHRGHTAGENSADDGYQQLHNPPGGKAQVEVVHAQRAKQYPQQPGCQAAFLVVAGRGHVVLGHHVLRLVVVLLGGLGVLGRLVLAPWEEGRRLVLGADAAVTSFRLREQRYGVLSEVLVRDRTTEEVQRVADEDFLRRGGRCRRVLTMPGKSSYQAMRYSGEYQLEQARKELRTLELELPAAFAAWPGELVELRLAQNVGTGLWRVRESVSAQEERGSYTRLTLAPPDVLG